MKRLISVEIFTNKSRYGYSLYATYYDGGIAFLDEISPEDIKEIKRACEKWLSNHPEELSR